MTEDKNKVHGHQQSDAGLHPKNEPSNARAVDLAQLVPLGKLLLIAAIFVFFAWHWSFFSEWLRSVRHAELPFGVKVDREQADKNIRQIYARTGENRREGDPDIARSAVNQAELLSPAIQGAKVLWVDPMPSNNRYERRILESMGINVQIALSTDEALELIGTRDESPDLVISDMGRKDRKVPLIKCPGVYFDFPKDEPLAQYHGEIWRYNLDLQKDPQPGMAMAELMATVRPDLFGDHQRPRIIFYTSSSGGRAANLCSRIITNRPDVLLENVVATLASVRSSELPDIDATSVRAGVGK